MFKRFTLLFIVFLLLVAPAVYAQQASGGLLTNPGAFQELIARMPRVQRFPGVFHVNTTADILDLTPGDGLCLTASGTCSFRAAIQESNTIDPGSVIYVPAGTYVLSIIDPLTQITTLYAIQSTSIIGEGVGKTIIDGNDLGAVFALGSGASLQHVTVTGGIGIAEGGNSRTAGAIIVAGTPDGAGVLINDVEVTGNTANTGGGIAIASGSSVNIINTTIADNVATQGTTSYPFTGGGLVVYAAAVSLSNVTISGNTAPDAAGMVIHDASDVSLNNVTVAFNAATTIGGGIHTTVEETDPIDPIITLRNSIIAANTAPIGPDCNATVASQGDNVVGNSSGCTGLTGADIVNVDALLAPLALNLPGTTQTHALLVGSPAIDAGSALTCLPADQRGMSRLGTCDIGAYEATPDLVVNGGFEADLAPWVLKNGTDDKIKCDANAHTGSCAFQFTGGAGENSKIQQNAAIAGITFVAGNELSFGAWINASSPTTLGKLKVRVKYADSTPTGKITQDLALTAGYVEYTDVITVGSATITKIKVQIQNTSTSGKIYVDDVRLVYQPASAAAIPLPLPLP